MHAATVTMVTNGRNKLTVCSAFGCISEWRTSFCLELAGWTVCIDSWLNKCQISTRSKMEEHWQWRLKFIGITVIVSSCHSITSKYTMERMQNLNMAKHWNKTVTAQWTFWSRREKNRSKSAVLISWSTPKSKWRCYAVLRIAAQVEWLCQ